LVEKKPCVVCGEPAAKELFKGSTVEVPVCSLTCENQYIESLSHKETEQQRILQYLDQKINRMRLFERLGWAIATFGLLLILIAVFWTNYQPTESSLTGPMFFMSGIIPLTCGTHSTIPFSNGKKKLLEKKRQLGHFQSKMEELIRRE
jgi:hypothetical protein